tara:strand:- start:162 stop:1259 length:1098 start_codon:yes stop_codon:yes gene_type:complete
MDFFLPIAQVHLNLWVILLVSFGVGFVSGLFGIGGGFLMTPLLVFLGIPPAFAVANEANNILGTSVSGALTHWFKKTLDYKMGIVIVLGGIIGTVIGMLIFQYFIDIGKINSLIALSYIYLLAIVGTLMFAQGAKEISALKKKIVVKKKLHTHYWIHGLPFKIRFHKSKLYESAITPIFLGMIVGIIATVMGVGGAFLLVPAMIYLIGMPTKLVPGTSLFVTIFITIFVVIGHAFKFQTIDLVLVLVLLSGSIFGLHLGLKIAEKLNPSEYKTLLATLLLVVGIMMGFQEFVLEKGENLFVSKKLSEPTVISDLSQYLLNFSSNFPIYYAVLSIVLVIFIGAIFSYVREYIHYLKIEFSNKKKVN